MGLLVKKAEGARGRLADLPVADFEAVAPGAGAEVRGSLGVANAIAAFRSFGSTAPAEVAAQLAAWRERLT